MIFNYNSYAWYILLTISLYQIICFEGTDSYISGSMLILYPQHHKFPSQLNNHTVVVHEMNNIQQSRNQSLTIIVSGYYPACMLQRFVCCRCCCLAARDHVLLALFYSVLFRVHTCSKWTGTRRRRLTHDQGYDMSDGLIVHVLQVSLPVFAQYLKLLTLDKWKLQA